MLIPWHFQSALLLGRASQTSFYFSHRGKKKKMQILGICHHEGKENLLKFHSYLDSPELRWTDSRHLQILCRERPHLQGVLLTGVEQFLRATRVTGNFILSHQSFSCRFTRWFSVTTGSVETSSLPPRESLLPSVNLSSHFVSPSLRQLLTYFCFYSFPYSGHFI